MDPVAKNVVKYFLLFISFLASSCGRNFVTKRFLYFGTFIDVTLPSEKTEVFNEVEEEIKRLHTLLSVSDGSLFELNEKGVLENAEIAGILSRLAEVSDISGGMYDVTCENLLRLWGFSPVSETKRIPSADEISSALKKTGWEKVKISGSTIYTQGVKINFGSCGKGYLLEKLSEIFRKNGISTALVNAGGGVLSYGTKKWKIGIRDPFNGGIMKTVFLKDSACATSGNYGNFFEKNGRTYGHIINPLTGYPSESENVQVTVFSKSPFEADVWATTFILLSDDEIKTIADKKNLQFFIVKKDGSVFTNR